VAGGGDIASLLLRSAQATLLLTSPLRDVGLAHHLATYGEGVRDIALRVMDVSATIDEARRAGATVVQEPELVDLGTTQVIRAVLRTCGALQHSIIEYDVRPDFAIAGLVPINSELPISDRGIESIDHVAIGVEAGLLDRYCDLYCTMFGMNITHREQVVTKLTAMNSKVIQNATRTVTFSMVSPLGGRRRSQVEEFLDYNGGAGAQHLAFLSRDIIRTVRELKAAGLDFLNTPPEYYAAMPRRVGRIEEDLQAIQNLGILVDRDAFGYLLQTFSKPVETVPTFFIEVIQRRGAQGFGSGNIRALFEALEREQAARRTL
jgi:4-hydroxyphenylpyruvate dioxygenase